MKEGIRWCRSSIPDLPAEDVMEMVHRFYDEYYFRPKAAFRILRKAAFDSADRKRLYKEAKAFLKTRAMRNKWVRDKHAFFRSGGTGQSLGLHVTVRKYLVLAGVAVFAAIGDSMLSRGMKESVPYRFTASKPDRRHARSLDCGRHRFSARLLRRIHDGPLLGRSYLRIPATSLGYVLLALIAKFVLHEQVTMWRWVGIGLIAVGVSFVASGPELTPKHPGVEEPVREPELAGYRGDS